MLLLIIRKNLLVIKILMEFDLGLSLKVIPLWILFLDIGQVRKKQTQGIGLIQHLLELLLRKARNLKLLPTIFPVSKCIAFRYHQHLSSDAAIGTVDFLLDTQKNLNQTVHSPFLSMQSQYRMLV